MTYEGDLANSSGDIGVFGLRSGNYRYDLRFDSTGRTPACRTIETASGPMRPGGVDPGIEHSTTASVVTYRNGVPGIDQPRAPYSIGSNATIATITRVSDCNDTGRDINPPPAGRRAAARPAAWQRRSAATAPSR